MILQKPFILNSPPLPPARASIKELLMQVLITVIWIISLFWYGVFLSCTLIKNAVHSTVLNLLILRSLNFQKSLSKIVALFLLLARVLSWRDIRYEIEKCSLSLFSRLFFWKLCMSRRQILNFFFCTIIIIIMLCMSRRTYLYWKELPDCKEFMQT